MFDREARAPSNARIQRRISGSVKRCGEQALSCAALCSWKRLRSVSLLPQYWPVAVKRGASREAIAETLAMAIYMGAGPSVMYAAEALEAVDQITAKSHGPA